MAYRFLLETPEALARETEITVGGVDDAQIVVSRASFAEGFDDPYSALTVASQTLRVIDRLYDWYDGVEIRPDIRLVLNSGERLALADHDRGEMVAAIRRDQPWVERTIPHIGDHAEDEFLTDAMSMGVVNAIVNEEPLLVDVVDRMVPIPDETAHLRRVVIEGVNYVAIRVAELNRAEQFYIDLFDMEIVARTRYAPDGTYRLLPADYVWLDVVGTGDEAEDTFLRNGALMLVLHRVGRGARIDRDLLDRIAVRVTGQTFTNMKGRVLMSNYEIVHDGPTTFIFVDPYGVPWEIALIGALPEITRDTLLASVR